ncbi:protein ORF102 [Cyprinid herpesvirus 3]|uniref:ORF102L n=1 Tax=Cyprinid herpesvirus 3 TaxID=180230 RepID=A3QTR1_CYHV3|nr:unnamed protein product [Cyprinid herpesvirus 3]ABG42929.1 protein ORF102 [Cyprinid herpesvirus 3]AIC32457.1 ORF102L [Cyprinid herpesvirus 3]AJP55590.1 protein ORF102 [Cyprinid herpesvirus 3]AJP55745.1 protein ORF102 [Cyprinid herpesvirus 3]AOO32506.1 protein ORF102 [Cyprinid herpesvirus 3]
MASRLEDSSIQWPFGNSSAPTTSSSEISADEASNSCGVGAGVGAEEEEDRALAAHLASEQQRLQDELGDAIDEVVKELSTQGFSLEQIQSIFAVGRLDPINHTSCGEGEGEGEEKKFDVASELSSRNLVITTCEDGVFEVQCQTCGARMSAKLEFWSLPGFADFACTQRCDLSVMHPHVLKQIREVAVAVSHVRVYARGFEPSNNNHENQRYSLYSIGQGRFPHRMLKLRDRLQTWSMARDVAKLPYRANENWSRQGLYVFQGEVRCAWCDSPPTMAQLMSGGSKFKPCEHECPKPAPRDRLRRLEVMGSGIVGRVPLDSPLAARLAAVTHAQAADHNRCILGSELFDGDARRFGDKRLLYAGYSDLMVCCSCLCVCAGLSVVGARHECPSESDLLGLTTVVCRAGALTLGMDVKVVPDVGRGRQDDSALGEAVDGVLGHPHNDLPLMYVVDDKPQRKRSAGGRGVRGAGAGAGTGGVVRSLQLNHGWTYKRSVLGHANDGAVRPVWGGVDPASRMPCLSKLLSVAGALRLHEKDVERHRAAADASNFRRLLFV